MCIWSQHGGGNKSYFFKTVRMLNRSGKLEYKNHLPWPLHTKIHQLCTTKRFITINKHQQAPTAIPVPIVLWDIWKNKNSKLYKNSNIRRATNTIKNISFQAMEYFHLNQISPKKVPRYMIILSWRKPLDEKYKLNTHMNQTLLMVEVVE